MHTNIDIIPYMLHEQSISSGKLWDHSCTCNNEYRLNLSCQTKDCAFLWSKHQFYGTFLQTINLILHTKLASSNAEIV